MTHVVFLGIIVIITGICMIAELLNSASAVYAPRHDLDAKEVEAFASAGHLLTVDENGKRRIILNYYDR